MAVHTTNDFLKELAMLGIAAKFIPSDLPVEVLRLSLEGKDLLRVLICHAKQIPQSACDRC